MLGLGIALVRREEVRLARVLSDLHLFSTGNSHKRYLGDSQHQQPRVMRSKLLHRSIPIALSRLERSLVPRRHDDTSTATVPLVHQVALTRALHFFDSERARYLAEESASLQHRIADTAHRLKRIREVKRSRHSRRTLSDGDTTASGEAGDDIATLVEKREEAKLKLEQLLTESIVARPYLSARLWKRLLLLLHLPATPEAGTAAEGGGSVEPWLLWMQCTTHMCRTVLAVIRSGGVLNAASPRFVASPRRVEVNPTRGGAPENEGADAPAEKEQVQPKSKRAKRVRFLPKPAPHLLLPLCWDSCAHVLQTCDALVKISDEAFRLVLRTSGSVSGLHCTVKLLQYCDALVSATRIINGRQPLTPVAQSVLSRSSVVRDAGARVIVELQECADLASSVAALGCSAALDVMVGLHRVCGWNVESRESRSVLQSLVVCVVPLLATNTFSALSHKLQSIVSQTRLGPKERAAVRRRSRLRGASRAEEAVLCNVEEHKLHNKQIRAALSLRHLDNAYQACLDTLAAEPAAAVFTGFQLCCMAVGSERHSPATTPSCFRSAACVLGEAVVAHLAATPAGLDSVLALTMTAAAVLSSAHFSSAASRHKVSPLPSELPNEHRILSGVLQYLCQHLTWVFSECLVTRTVEDAPRSTTETPTLKQVALLCDVVLQLRSDAHLRRDVQEQLVEMLRMQRTFLISRNDIWWKQEQQAVSTETLITVVDCHETFGVADKPLLELLHCHMVSPGAQH